MAFIMLFKKADNPVYRESPIYSEMLLQVDSLNFPESNTEIIKAGWSEQEIVPKEPVPIASYGIRNIYKGIHDSVYVKTFSFSNNQDTIYWVTTDLLIFPPEVVQELEQRLGSEKLRKIFFSATHTHNGPGGWLKSPFARFITGPYEKEYVHQITSAVIRSMEAASNNLEAIQIGLGKASVPEFVGNRVVQEGEKDSVLQFITLTKQHTKQNSIITFFSAHANCLNYQYDYVSGDYPSALTDSLKRKGFDFAAFNASAVGSMSTTCYGKADYDCIGMLASGMTNKIKEANLSEVNTTRLFLKKILLPLGPPSPNIHENWTVRPWLFHAILGKPEANISVLLLGEIIIIGLPCDFSGVIANKIKSQFPGKEIIFTSFNGSYIGYVTPDSYSNINHRETREMNWYGPGFGSYLKDMIEKILSQL